MRMGDGSKRLGMQAHVMLCGDCDLVGVLP